MWLRPLRPHCMYNINCKHASKEVAALKQNIAPPAREDTTPLTHAQPELKWDNPTFILNISKAAVMSDIWVEIQNIIS